MFIEKTLQDDGLCLKYPESVKAQRTCKRRRKTQTEKGKEEKQWLNIVVQYAGTLMKDHCQKIIDVLNASSLLLYL